MKERQPPDLKRPRERTGEGGDALARHFRLEHPLHGSESLTGVQVGIRETRNVLRQPLQQLVNQFLYVRLRDGHKSIIIGVVKLGVDGKLLHSLIFVDILGEIQSVPW